MVFLTEDLFRRSCPTRGHSKNSKTPNLQIQIHNQTLPYESRPTIRNACRTRGPDSVAVLSRRDTDSKHHNNDSLSNGSGVFFDVLATSTALKITELTTASSVVAGGTFTLEIFTRSGSGLGGPVSSGSGSSSTGWTSLGTASATQGAESSGISLTINIPDIYVPEGQTMGVAMVFIDAAPRYFGTGTPPIQEFTDGTLTLNTGNSRTSPFTTSGNFFSSRGLTGSLTYEVVPEPAMSGLLALSSLAFAAGRRRRK